MRAIILAAGMGTRLRPLTSEIPKPLVPVNGKPMLERQIEFLKEKGIDEIIVMTGYLREKFDYLKERYDVTLVHNDKFEEFNNIYTMYLAREYLKKGAYVVEGDIHLTKNVFIENPKSSFYMSAKKPHFKKEWIFDMDKQGKIHDIHVGDGHNQYIMSGVAYLKPKDAKTIVTELEKVASKLIRDKHNNVEDKSINPKYGKKTKYLFWDDVVTWCLKSNLVDVYLKPLASDDVYEIDSLAEWQDLQTKLDKPSVASFMSSYGLFRELQDSYLEKNRHKNDLIQEAYDKRFGLVVVK